MFIYISGTHPTQQTRRVRIKKDEIERENSKKLFDTIAAISKKGHLPVISYTMLQGWNDIDRVSQKFLEQTSHNWLMKCDAIYFIKTPADAESESERQFATSQNLPISYSIDQIPESHLPKLSPEAFKAYLVEYEQCMQNFRNIYTTIWQAGALFAAISAGIITFASSSIIG